MMITFARVVPVDADLDAEEANLLATAEGWALRCTGETLIATVERSSTFSFVETGGMVLQGLEMVAEYGLRREILLEAKVEVDE